MKRRLVVRNILGRPAKSAALMLLAAILSFSMFAGTMTVLSLRKGILGLENRMGADIMVVPAGAMTKANTENSSTVLLGNMGYHYMDNEKLQQIASREGVGDMSAQFYLSSLSSSCCSVPVQIVGFDPETDFTISPWIRQRLSGELNALDVVVGNDLNAFVGDTLTFYHTDVRVAAKLERTGTDLDTAVYTSTETIRLLVDAAKEIGIGTYKDADPDRQVSSVLIRLEDGADADEVCNDINTHVRRVTAIRAKGLFEDMAASLSGISRVIFTGIAVVWVLGLALFFIACSMSVKERKKEFALLRVIGAPKKKVSRIIREECLLLGFSGALLGIFVSLALLIPFARLIESALSLPFLLPGAGEVTLAGLSALLLTALCAALAGMRAARSAQEQDAGLILREA